MLALPTGNELLLVVALTLLPSLAVVGAVLLLLRRGRRSTRAYVLLACVGALVSMGVGIGVVSQAMFLSAHDLGLLAFVLALMAGVGTTGALQLASTLGREGRRLERAAAAVGGDGPVWEGPLPVTAELAAVARRMQQTSEELTQARQARQQADQARQELAEWMSHDLRTPLAGIRAMAEALEDEVVAEPADVRRYHRQLRVDAERLGDMVDDLFELSRLQAHAARHPVTTFDVQSVVDEVVGGCRALDPQRLLLVPPAPEPLLVTAGRQDLARALRNLVANAMRYSPSGSPVVVEAAGRDGQVLVHVQDACGGIAETDLPRLFDVGYRGSSARTPDARDGAGLGLAITRRLVEAHAGTVDVMPVPGGCRFTLALPRRTVAVPLQDVAPHAGAAASKGDRRPHRSRPMP